MHQFSAISRIIKNDKGKQAAIVQTVLIDEHTHNQKYRQTDRRMEETELNRIHVCLYLSRVYIVVLVVVLVVVLAVALTVALSLLRRFWASSLLCC